MPTPYDDPTRPVPIEELGPPVPLYGRSYIEDQAGVHARMWRDYGPLVPVELWPGVAATLVIGYRAARQILGDPYRFPADPRGWARRFPLPAGCPIAPMIEWRPNALRSAGDAHTRYRRVAVDGLSGIDPYRLRALVLDTATTLVNGFCRDGTVEIVDRYAYPLTFTVLNQLVGCTPEVGAAVAAALAAMFDASDTATVNARLTATLGGLIADKHRDLREGRLAPDGDITTRMLTHPAGLTEQETIHQLVTVYAAGIEPTVGMLTKTLLQILTDPRYAVNGAGHGPPVADAVDTMLVTGPPMDNYCLSYPTSSVEVEGVWLPALRPVLISMFGVNNDPSLGRTCDYSRAHWHMAWGGNSVHNCPEPARVIARTITETGLEILLGAFPDLTLACPATDLPRRHSPFQLALTRLPARFSPGVPLPAAFGSSFSLRHQRQP
ncbi:cytochrome P450 [Nocardia sp. alder85J]|uniref:cytochrome P450 n=1 Tax=Nocardia sp. alder85J TaxID=2862949 RepID=UPI001CD3AFCF|nr:cytochrome P450 [Nocardia sp. alder85J]MCX4094575.1 cytochrome P450 [Nocardia sp. alder85J]